MSSLGLAISIISIILLLVCYLGLAVFYDRLGSLHMRVRDFIMSTRRPWLDPIMRATHTINGAVSMSVITALVALLLGLYWKGWKDAFLMTTAMVGVTAIIHATKAIHKSNRPPQIIVEILMKTYSYPSGHSAASMTFALVVPMFLGLHLNPAVVSIIAVFLLINAVATAYGRMYLDMHWLADILGGWCMAGIVTIITHMLLTIV